MNYNDLIVLFSHLIKLAALLAIEAHDKEPIFVASAPFEPR